MDGGDSETLRQGMVAGVIGYATVALFYLGMDLGTGAPAMDTALRLGTALVGSAHAAQPGGAFGPILAFNGVHLTVSLLAGMAAAWLFHEVDLHPRLYFATLAALVVGLVAATALLGILGAGVAGAVSWRSVAVAVLLAAAAMGLYLWSANPALAGKLAALEE